MNERVLVEAIFPINDNFHLSKSYDIQTETALAEFREIIETEEFDITSSVLKQKVNFQNGIQINKKNIPFLIHKHQVYFSKTCFTLFFEFEPQKKGETSLTKDSNELNSLFSDKFIVAESFAEIIYELILIINIARPGSITLFEGIVLVDGVEKCTTPGFSIILNEAYDSSIEKKYPTFNFHKTSLIRNWMNENDVSIFNKPKNKLSTAINCLSYVYNYELLNSEKLTYSLIGLEALYTKGNANITEQLNEKIQVYLGEIQDFKKMLKDMYSVRSRFLHGVYPIRPLFLYDNTDENEYENEIYNALIVGSGILACTIQQMIIENRIELEFSFRLN